MHPRFQTAFAQLAENLQSALAPVLADAHFPALLTAEQVATLKQATGLDEDALAFALLPLAASGQKGPPRQPGPEDKIIHPRTYPAPD